MICKCYDPSQFNVGYRYRIEDKVVRLMDQVLPFLKKWLRTEQLWLS